MRNGHDDLGRLTSAEKTIGGTVHTWEWTYDWAGRQTEAVDPDTGVTTTSYDGNGNVDKVETELGITDTDYDAWNRPTTRWQLADIDDEAGDDDVVAKWSYDTAVNGKGRLASIVSSNPQFQPGLPAHTYQVDSYDAAGRVTKTSESLPTAYIGSGSGTALRSTTYDYSAGGLLTKVAFPQVVMVQSSQQRVLLPATDVTYAYGTNQVLKAMKASGDTTLASFSYDNLGQLTGLDSTTGGTSPTSLDRSYTWDTSTGRLATTRASATGTVAGSSSTATLRLGYDYDKVGNPTQITRTQTNGTNPGNVTASCYTYDGLNRLSSAVTADIGSSSGTCPAEPAATSSWIDYGYGETGDRLEQVSSPKAGEEVAFTYDTDATTGPHQIAAIAGDADGTVDPGLPSTGTFDWASGTGRADSWTPDGAAKLLSEYDAAGRLLVQGEALDEGPRVQHAYDADGIRILRQVTNPDASVNATIYAGDAEIDARKASEASTTFTPVTARRTITTPSGTPVATQKAVGNGLASWTWLFADQQNTIRQTTSATVTETFDYTAYGAVLPATTGAGPSAQPGTPGARGYLGKPHDPSGEIRLDQRNYNPANAGFTAPDPILVLGDPQSYNPYAYSGHNPITNADPSGMIFGDPTEAGHAPHCIGSCEEYQERQDYFRENSPDADGDGYIDGWGPDTVAGAANAVLTMLDMTSFSILTGIEPGEMLSSDIDEMVGADRRRPAYAGGQVWGTLATFAAGGALGTVAKSTRLLPASRSSERVVSAAKGVDAATPIGGRGRPLNVTIPTGQTARNAPTVIGGRSYSAHALDRMQGQGIMPSVVESTVVPRNAIAGKVPGTTAYYDDANNVTVILNSGSGRVITVDYGRIRQ